RLRPAPGAIRQGGNAVLRGIAAGHPFNDGNKRTGLLTAMYFLELVGIPRPVPFPGTDAESLCMRVSSGQVRDVETIATELGRLWQIPGGGRTKQSKP